MNQLQLAQQAEEVWDFLNHLGWKDIIKPKLLKKKSTYEKLLVDHLLGSPLPGGYTKEQIAGKIYGINEIISTIESILKDGKKALDSLTDEGIAVM